MMQEIIIRVPLTNKPLFDLLDITPNLKIPPFHLVDQRFLIGVRLLAF